VRFHQTPLPGVIIIDVDPIEDARGWFARTWCDREAAAAGLRTPMVQDSVAINRKAGTLRGLHFHAAPFPQARVLRCIAGEAFVAAVDLRAIGATFLRAFHLVLDAGRQTALYAPPGVALGYQTLMDQTVIGYKMPMPYDSRFERGVRWNDRAFRIEWPAADPILNDRDATYPDFDPRAFAESLDGAFR
jgi:dTDP-4-dehydrorhamnose 3,5-epimerase